MLIASHAMPAVYPLNNLKIGILGAIGPCYLEEISFIATFLCNKGVSR